MVVGAKAALVQGATPRVAIDHSMFSRFVWIMTSDGRIAAFRIEDFPHKGKRVMSACAHPQKHSMCNIVDKDLLLAVAAGAAKYQQIFKHLQGSADAMDTAGCTQIFLNKDFVADVIDLDTPAARDTGAVLEYFAGIYRSFEEKGLSEAERSRLTAEYCEFHSQIVSQSAWLGAETPKNNVMGFPYRLLEAMHANADSVAHFRAFNPDLFLALRNLNTYPCEHFFGSLVRRNHGKKPDAATAGGLMRGLDIFAAIKSRPGRGFRLNFSKRAMYDIATTAREVKEMSRSEWQGVPLAPGSMAGALHKAKNDRARLIDYSNPKNRTTRSIWSRK
jgi:hypothetical protein